MTVTTSVTEGARWERHERGAGEEVDAALVSRILQFCRLKHMHNIVLSSLNLKKKRLLIVYSPASRSALFQQEKTVIWLSNNNIPLLASFFGKDVQILANVQPSCWPRKL